MITNKNETGSGMGVVWILRPSSIGIAMEVHVCGKLCTIEMEFHVLGGLDVSEYMLCCFCQDWVNSRTISRTSGD